MNLDKWQQEVLNTKGNMCLRSGRQVGKSTIISIKAGEEALKRKGISVMVIASVERQAQLLFEKILSHIYLTNKSAIKTGKDRPTKHQIRLKNGSVIHSLPTGESGYGIRGYTIDLLIADEAAFIPEDVWTAVMPMLAVTKGNVWLLSTPHGREGFYYRSFSDEKFTSFHISAEDCPRKNVAFLEHEKTWMTKMQYAQEYLGEFADQLMQFFPNDLINKSCILSRSKDSLITSSAAYFLGVDVARMGEDESTFEIIDRTDRKKLIHVESEITRKTLTTETAKKIINLNLKWGFKAIYIDDGGMGVGVFDQLLQEDEVKRKVVGINNASRSIDSDPEKPQQKKLLKEDLYNNLLRLMERNEIKLLDDDEIKLSLRSIQFEYTATGLKIFGSYSHVCEGIIRAAWCVMDKSLNPYIN